MGICQGEEYMNEVNWPEKKLKQGYNIEMCFSYPDEDEENRYMWCCVIVMRFKRREDDKSRYQMERILHCFW